MDFDEGWEHAGWGAEERGWYRVFYLNAARILVGIS